MEFFLPVYIFAFTTTITPGPNNIMIMTSGMNFGIKPSLPHLLGICIGFPLMVLFVGLGLGSVFDKYPILHDVIKILGLIYLCFLAWKIANAKPFENDSSTQEEKSSPLTFLQSALFQWVNPKAWMMATGAVATYTLTSGNIYLQSMLITLAFFLAGVPSITIWLFFGTKLKQILTKTIYQRIFNVTMAVLLIGSMMPVFLETFV